MNYDFSADFLTMDCLEPLTLKVSGQANQIIPQALSEPAEWKDPDKAAGNVLEGDELWIWPKRATPAKPPLGSILADSDGISWTILSITSKPAPLNVWEAHCRNLSVVYNLNNLASVYKATYAKSAGGEALATYSVLLTDIPARFQPFEQEAKILEDADWPKTTYHVYLGTDIFEPNIPVEPASADYRLVDAAGRHYRIMQYQRPERIDALPLAVCVLIIEGSEGGATDRVTTSGA